MFLTQSGGIIIKPISILLGKLLSLIYDGLNFFGIVNIGIAIIIFTLIIRLILFPFTVKQNKNSKITNYIQPEINKVTKKYKGKKDQDSMMAQQREVKEIQDKYGINMTSGCLTSLLQLPIFFALYRVILNVPAYVDKIKNLYSPIADAIMKNDKVSKAFIEFHDKEALLSSTKLDISSKNTVIDVLAKFEEGTWNQFTTNIQGNSDVINAINSNVDQINDAYNFGFGINLTTAPGLALTSALAIPILSMVFQFLSMHVTPQQPATDPQQEATMRSMKTFMNIFPIMSFIVCLNVPAGVGLYWAAGAFISYLTSLGINIYFKHCDMEKVVERSKNKAAKKAAKRKAKGKKSFMEKLQEAAYAQEANQQANPTNRAINSNLKSYVSSTSNNNNNSGVKYKQGSLASKANIMQKYNDNNNGGK